MDVVSNRLTLPQRVGQLLALGLANDELGPTELGAIRTQHVGSVWFTKTTTAGAAAVRAVATAVQAQATRAATGGVRFFVAANQEGGEIQALRGPGFSTIPTAVAQGTFDPATLQRDAATWGTELSKAGVVDTVTTRNDSFLAPFRAAVAAGVPVVMVALATYTRIDPHHLAAT